MKKTNIIFLFILLVSLGCSTQKNTWLSRGYHNLTARYNVLFNGQQSFSSGEEKMRESVKNDYTQILPAFAYSDNSGGQVSSSDMNRAIRKGYKLIEKHSITAKPSRSVRGAGEEYRSFYNQREFNRWVDEAYMLIGKAHVYSRDWYEGIGAFNMVLQLFPEKSVRFEAMLWMARAYIEMGDFKNAKLYLDRYSSGVENEQKFLSTATATYAWFWIAQDQPEKAMEYCPLAAENATDRWQRIRWYFIMGQLAERIDNSAMAMDAYEKVISMNPDYEMVIHARVNNAMIAGRLGDAEEAREVLKKYAREFKNLDYRDQIYYALAQTYLAEEDTLNALLNLQLAAGYGGKDRILAGNIYHQMADIYFQSSEYVAADAYYDSTLTVLPKDYPGVEKIHHFRQSLTPLAENLRTLQYEDSVQRIAALPEEERTLFIDNLLASMQQQEQQAQAGGAPMDDAFFYRNFANRGSRSTDESGKWYFYNQTMVSLGQMEFEKRWGRREDEDNWRRKNKTSLSDRQTPGSMDGMMPDDPFSQQPPGPGGQESVEDSGGKPDRESLVSGLPLTPEALKESHLKVQKARFNAGHLLAQNFDKHEEAIEQFEELISAYPQTDLREQVLTGIYLSCAEIPDRRCMAHYGQVIMDDYPDSRFAAFVDDPEYFEKLERRHIELDSLYVLAFEDYKKGYWGRVLEQSDMIVESGYDAIKPNAMLLRAAAYSRMGNTNSFREGLLALSNQYSQSSQAEVARHWLELLKQGKEPEQLLTKTPGSESPEPHVSGEDSAETESQKFSFTPDSTHYLMIVLQPEADVNQILFYLANFNFDRYTIGGLRLESSTLGGAYNTLQTGPFENSRVGLDYFFALLNNPSVFAVDNPGRPLLLLVSEGNYSELNNASDIELYRQFFLDNYLPGSDPSAIVVTESEIPEEPYKSH